MLISGHFKDRNKKKKVKELTKVTRALNQAVRTTPFTFFCCYDTDSYFKCKRSGPITLCASNHCMRLIHVHCFSGFLSLLTKKCQRNFTLIPLCPSCIIFQLCDKKLIQEDTVDPGYKNLFLHDFRHSDQVKPLLPNNKYERIPRGVVEHDDIIPEIPKAEFPKPVNLLLKENFDESLPTTPKHIK